MLQWRLSLPFNGYRASPLVSSEVAVLDLFTVGIESGRRFWESAWIQFAEPSLGVKAPDNKVPGEVRRGSRPRLVALGAAVVVDFSWHPPLAPPLLSSVR